ncbi:MAG: hypothetical protein IJ280_01005 [Bacteroidales bacterium]|nr:hypothetical protein [Bacteroidales bacterium]
MSPKQFKPMQLQERGARASADSSQQEAEFSQQTAEFSQQEAEFSQQSAEFSQQEADVIEVQMPDTVAIQVADSSEMFVPDSNKALWFAALCPGLGQIYNRRYWKLPIVAGGIVGVSYAISWNGKYYEAYTYAYRDLIDGDPNTNYFKELIPPGASYSESQLQTVFKNRQQSFRRQRDLSIIVGVGLYLICLLDAYVDAELFTFDISDNLSFEWGSRPQPATEWRSPAWLPNEQQNLNLSFSLNF